MKIRLSYLPGEEVRAERVKRLIRQMFPAAKIKDVDNHSTFRHCYIDTRMELPDDTTKD